MRICALLLFLISSMSIAISAKTDKCLAQCGQEYHQCVDLVSGEEVRVSSEWLSRFVTSGLSNLMASDDQGRNIVARLKSGKPASWLVRKSTTNKDLLISSIDYSEAYPVSAGAMGEDSCGRILNKCYADCP